MTATSMPAMQTTGRPFPAAPGQRAAAGSGVGDLRAGDLGRAPLAFLVGVTLDALLGLDLVIAGDWMALAIAPGVQDIAGIPTGAFLAGLGACLLAMAAATFALVQLDAGPRWLWVIVGINEAWIVASLAVLAFARDGVSGFGLGLIAATAAATLALATAQIVALRRPAEA